MRQQFTAALLLSLAVGPLVAADKLSRCAPLNTCFECVTEGCGWCSFVLGQGRCMGLGDGEFTCEQVYNTIPSSTCWNHSTAGGSSGPGGGYNCVGEQSPGGPQCVTSYEGPTPPEYDTLSSCINKCRPQTAQPPFWRCNVTSLQCEVSQTEGTTKETCNEQCHDHRLCSGGQCVSQGVDGAGEKVCPGSTCPQPDPGPNCSSLSSKGCHGCLAASERCGWCPYFKQCHDIAPHAPLFFCPPGFTMNQSTCTQSALGMDSLTLTV